MSESVKSNLQTAIDAFLASEFGEMSMAKDWLLVAHAVNINDVGEDTGTLVIEKGTQTSFYTAVGMLNVASDIYQSESVTFTSDDDDE